MSNLSQYLVHLDEPLSKNNETGRGCYGVVYRSRLKGAKCVVKKLHDILTGGGGQQSVSETEWRAVVAKFRQEIELLSKQRHPNIVQFLGVCGLDGDPRDISLVMEQLDDDLTAFIENNKGKISLCMKLSILKDVACGLNHLHSTGIVHRDLNDGNVLLTSSLHAKVADLGVSRIIDSRPRYLCRLTLVPGAIDYMPPEALRPDPVYGPKLDCFSFGHLALYLAIEVYPRPSELADYELDLRTGQDGQLLICLQVQKRKQWIQKLVEDHPLNELICVCLSDPQQRPDMETVRQRLEKKMNNDNIPKLLDVLKEKQEFEDKIAQLNVIIKDKDKQLQKNTGEIRENKKELSKLSEGETFLLPSWCDSKYLRSATVVCVRVVDNFSAWSKTNGICWSEPLYSSEKGYKLEICIGPNGYGPYRGEYMYVGIQLMKGEYDANLSWPFKANVTVQILNWSSDNDHVQQTIHHHEAPLQSRERVVAPDKIRAPNSYGIHKFIPLKDLHLKSPAFLSSDRLCFRILRVDVIN